MISSSVQFELGGYGGQSQKLSLLGVAQKIVRVFGEPLIVNKASRSALVSARSERAIHRVSFQFDSVQITGPGCGMFGFD